MDAPAQSDKEAIQEEVRLKKIQIKLLTKDRTRALIANSDDERFQAIETSLANAETELKHLQNRLKEFQAD